MVLACRTVSTTPQNTLIPTSDVVQCSPIRIAFHLQLKQKGVYLCCILAILTEISRLRWNWLWLVCLIPLIMSLWCLFPPAFINEPVSHTSVAEVGHVDPKKLAYFKKLEADYHDLVDAVNKLVASGNSYMTKEDGLQMERKLINEQNALVSGVKKHGSQLMKLEQRLPADAPHLTYGDLVELIEKKAIGVVSEKLRKYNEDKTGETDFALESSGGQIVSSSKSYAHNSYRERFLGISLWHVHHPPQIVIQRKSQNVNAGECWSVQGSEAYLVIKLAQKLDVTAVTYEHLARSISIAKNMESAPKNFKIWVCTFWSPSAQCILHFQSLAAENDPNKFLIGEYVFDEYGGSLQTFEAQEHDPRGTPLIKFEVTSNYGAPYTCLYRFRVHGNPLDQYNFM